MPGISALGELALGQFPPTGRTGRLTIMGPGGAPMRPPYGSFANKPETAGGILIHTVMGPAGAPMRPPYGSFAGKPASGPTAFALPEAQPIINSYPGRMWVR